MPATKLDPVTNLIPDKDIHTRSLYKNNSQWNKIKSPNQFDFLFLLNGKRHIYYQLEQAFW